MKSIVKIYFGFVLMLMIIFVFTGCSLGNATDNCSPASESGNLKFAYVCKFLQHPWFVQESWGAEKKCEELGVEYVAVNGSLKDDEFIAAIDNVISQGIDGLLVCTPNEAVGPAVAAKCKEANIPLISIDGSIKDISGVGVPHIEAPAITTGEIAGRHMIEMATEKGFFEKGNVVKVMQINMSSIPTTQERIQGYTIGINAKRPQLLPNDFVTGNSRTGFFEDNAVVASAIVNANPEVTHWLICGLNDDAAIAPLKVLEEIGFDMDRVIACGLGGYDLSLNEFLNGNENYFCMYLKPHEEGALAMQLLYDNVINGKEIPIYSAVPGEICTIENYESYFPNGKTINQQ